MKTCVMSYEQCTSPADHIQDDMECNDFNILILLFFGECGSEGMCFHTPGHWGGVPGIYIYIYILEYIYAYYSWWLVAVAGG